MTTRKGSDIGARGHRGTVLRALAFSVPLCLGAPVSGFAQCPDGAPPPCRGTSRSVAAQATPNSVAVLYFVTRDSTDAYLADGLTEEIATSLGRVARLQVKSPSAVRRAQHANAADLKSLGRALAVRYLVEISLRRAGAQLRITARLVEAQSENAAWSDAFSRSSDDLLAVQEEIARAVATGISGTLVPTEQANLSERPTRVAEAYDHFLRGNYFFLRRTREALDRAQAEYQEAARLDPAFVSAQARLATCYSQRLDYTWYETAAERDSLLARNRAIVDALVRRSPGSSDAWMAKGYLQWNAEPSTFAGARTALMRSLQLDPRNAEAWNRLGLLEADVGNDSAAMLAYRRALEVDPGRAVTMRLAAETAIIQRRYPVAHALLDSAIAMDPEQPASFVARTRLRLLMGDTAGARLDAHVAYRSGFPPGELVMALTDARTGNTARATARYADTRARCDSVPCTISRGGFEQVLLALGRNDDALAALERQPGTLRLCSYALRLPELDVIRAEPRFQRIVSVCASVREVR